MGEQDSIILKRWAHTGDSKAFMEIVARYQGMIYWVCLRILGGPGKAEDLVQECFLKLTQRQPKDGTLLGPWFHRVATNTALSQLRSDTRRMNREQEYGATQRKKVDAEWDEVCQILDEEVAALPEQSRDAIVLHYLEGNTQVAVAERLGVPRTTVSSRIKKGLDLLETRLGKRGIGVSATALAGMLVSEATHAAPVTLSNSLGKVVLSGQFKATTSTGSIAPKLVGVGVLVCLALLGWWAYGFSTAEHSNGHEQSAIPKQVILEKDAKVEAPLDVEITTSERTESSMDLAVPDGEGAAGQIWLQCVDPEGVAVPDALVYVYKSVTSTNFSKWVDGNKHKPWHAGPLKSDSEGLVSFSAYPKSETESVSYEAYAVVLNHMVGIWHRWGSTPKDPSGAPSPVPMVPTGTMTGQVLVPAGYPMSSIKVDVINLGIPTENNLTGYDSLSLSRLKNNRTTSGVFDVDLDSTGAFTVANIPQSGRFGVRARGDGLGERQVQIRDRGKSDSIELAMSVAGSIEGTVIFAERGIPAIQRVVYCRHKSRNGIFGALEGITDSLGQYRIEGLPEGRYEVMVKMSGYEPRYLAHPQVDVIVENGITTGGINFALEMGRDISGTVIYGETGEGIEGVQLGGLSPAKTLGVVVNWAKTDKDGRYTIRLPLGDIKLYMGSIPSGIKRIDEETERIFTVLPPSKPMASVDFELSSSELTYDEIPEGRVIGRVLDDAGKPIADVHVRINYLHEDGMPQGLLLHQPKGKTDKEGRFDLAVKATGQHGIRVGGKGRSAFVGKIFKIQEDDLKDFGDIVLRPFTLTLPIRVVDEAGEPLQDVLITAKAEDYYNSNDWPITNFEGLTELIQLPDDELALKAHKDGYKKGSWSGYADDGEAVIEMKRVE